MAKLTEAQERAVKESLKDGTALPEGVRINFGDPEPFQKNDEPAPKTGEKQG